MFQIGRGFSSYEKRQIMHAMAEIMRVSCVKFQSLKRKPANADFILISNGRRTCSSAVGRIGGEQRIYLGHDDCFDDEGTIMHELMHALGFVHEQQRPTR